MSDIPKFWLKIPGQKAMAIDRFDVVRFGLDCVVTGHSEGRPVVQFGGSPNRVLPELQEIIRAVDGRTVDQWAEPEPAPIPDDELMVPPADDARPQMGDIRPELSTVQKWGLIYQRFVNSPLASDGEFMHGLMTEYTRAVKAEGQLRQMQKGIEGPADQLTQDVARLLPIADSLRRSGKWNQSAIAKALGRNQSGGSNYTWITKVMTALDRELERRAA